MLKPTTFFVFTILLTFQLNAQWTLENLSIARSEAGSIEYNEKIYFIGGTNFDLPFADWSLANKKIDIYDTNTETFDSLFIPVQRQFSIAEVYNDKLYIVGRSNELSIYNLLSDTWSSQNLIGLGDVYRLAKIDNLLLMSNQFGSLNLLDMETDLLSTIEMPEKTFLVAMTACDDKFILAGGGTPNENTNLVQIYDPLADSWTTSSLSESKANLRGTCRNGIAYFAGGQTDVGDYTTKVEIYDVVNDIWTLSSIPFGRRELTVTATDNAVYIAGGYNGSLDPKYPTDITVFTSPTDLKTITLPEGRLQMGIIGFQDKAYFYGGAENNNKNYTSRIDIFDESTVANKKLKLETTTFGVFPNPVSDQLYINSENLLRFSRGIYSIISANGSIISKGIIKGDITIERIPTGNYQLILQDESRKLRMSASFVKI